MQRTHCIPYKFEEFLQVAILVSIEIRLWKSLKFMSKFNIYVPYKLNNNNRLSNTLCFQNNWYIFKVTQTWDVHN